MSVEVRLPQWGMGMLEGTVIEWYKSVGDRVTEGEPLAEIEAAKATEQLLAPATGVLTSVLVEAGRLVPVNELLATIGTAEAEIAGPEAVGGAVGAPAVAGEPASMEQPAAGGPSPAGGLPRVVPLARRRAAELGVDLATVVGSGPGGRVVVADVEAAAHKAAGPPEARVGAEPSKPPIAAPSVPVSAARGSAVSEAEGAPLSGIRRTIARRMTESLQTTAQYTLFRALDVTAVATFQRSVTAAPQPSFTDIFIRACALALREHPVVNARIEGDRLIERTTIDIGFAVAIEEGVLAPIVRAADTLSLAEISIRTRELAQQCRERRITTADLEGAGFGITSLGGQGIDAFTPILNPPEAGILGIGRTREQAVRYGEGLGWRTELIASLTLDHRVVDGAQGAAFLATIADLLADPRRLLG